MLRLLPRLSLSAIPCYTKMKCHGQIGKTIYEAEPCPDPVVWRVILLDNEVLHWCEKHGTPLWRISHPKVKWTRIADIRIDEGKEVGE
jgi:hypothetical protein